MFSYLIQAVSMLTLLINTTIEVKLNVIEAAVK